MHRSKTKSFIGIDLGTVYSSVGIWENGECKQIPNSAGQTRIPFYDNLNYKILCGYSHGHNRMPLNVNKLLGHRFDDVSVQEEIKSSPFRIIKDKSKNRPMFEIDYYNEIKQFHPQEITVMILSNLKSLAESYSEQPIENCVISIPSHFTNGQRQAIKDAGKIIGLNVLRLVYETTAAAIAYGSTDDEVHSIVFDLGAGTLSVALFLIEDGVFEALSIAGNTHLGGNLFDERIVQWMIKQISKRTKYDTVQLMQNRELMDKLRIQSEKAKCLLSTQETVHITLESLIDLCITRKIFEALCMDYFTECIQCVESVVKDAKIEKSRVQNVILIGGSSNIPKLRAMITTMFDNRNDLLRTDIDDAVTKGAIIQAGILSGADMEPFDDVLLLDVTPFSIGIETAGGVMMVLIPKNKTIPCKANETFSTYSDNCAGVCIQVYAGEGQRTKDNYLIGRYELMGIPPAPRGVPQIEVTFDLDANGIMSVSAKDKKNYTRSAKIYVYHSCDGGLSHGEIEALIEKWENANTIISIQEQFIMIAFIRMIQRSLPKRLIVPDGIRGLCCRYFHGCM
eukprot:867520_1